MKTMFGHLKAEQLMSLIEGGHLSENLRSHLNTCPTCQARQRSVESAYRDISVNDNAADHIPEPDWTAFRDSLRLQLLSRAVVRDSAVRRWTGWSIRPAMAWSLSLLLAICVGTGGFLWHVAQDRNRLVSTEPAAANDVPTTASPAVEVIPADPADIDPGIAMWANNSVFAEAGKLEGVQVEELRKLLESARKGTIEQQ
jgi:hypothetical protein